MELGHQFGCLYLVLELIFICGLQQQFLFSSGRVAPLRMTKVNKNKSVMPLDEAVQGDSNWKKSFVCSIRGLRNYTDVEEIVRIAQMFT